MYTVTGSPFGRPTLQRSTDGGLTWSTLESARISGHFYQVLDDPADPRYVYATVGDGLSPGVLVSRDGGNTWRKNQLDMLVTAIAANPTDPQILVCGDGLYLSRDCGKILTTTYRSPNRMNITDIVFGTDDVVYASDGAGRDAGLPVGGRGVLASRNAGQTWSTISAGLPNLDVRSLATSPDGSWLYARTGGGSVYRLAL